MTPVDSPTAARNAAHENDTAPPLSAHAGQAGLCHDELAAGVDLHHLVPVVLANVRRVADPATKAGIGDEHRDGLVLLRDLAVGEDAGHQVPGRFSGGEVGLEGDEELRWILIAQLLS